jgi:hypothetical protein
MEGITWQVLLKVSILSFRHSSQKKTFQVGLKYSNLLEKLCYASTQMTTKFYNRLKLKYQIT